MPFVTLYIKRALGLIIMDRIDTAQKFSKCIFADQMKPSDFIFAKYVLRMVVATYSYSVQDSNEILQGLLSNPVLGHMPTEWIRNVFSDL